MTSKWTVQRMVFGRILPLLLFIAGALALPARAETIEDLQGRETAAYRARCATVEIHGALVESGDFNHDQRDDAIINSGAVVCDGVQGPDCNMLGCPQRIYVRNRDGNFVYSSEVRAYGFRTYYRYGVLIIDFAIASNQCGKTSLSPCHMITRLHGTELKVISKE